MSRKNKPKRNTATVAVTSPFSATTAGSARFEINLLAFVASIITLLLAISPRHVLNPDGVSYLDLAAAIQRGDWQSFVQGYWSPLYPFVIAVAAKMTGTHSPLAMIQLAHVINGMAGVAAVFGVWRLARNLDNALFARLALSGLLLYCPQADASRLITPNIVLIAIFTWFSYELLWHKGERWARIGVLLGAGFLTSTSIWPWFLCVLPVRLLLATNGEERKRILASTAVVIGIAFLWIAPMSLKYGGPTLGDSGRLNYCWYVESCDSRTPDTHAENHRNYTTVPVEGHGQIAVAIFDPTPPWTYSPWSDPADWSRGVITRQSTAPTLSSSIEFWLAELWAILGNWLIALMLSVLIPALVISWKDGERQKMAERRLLVSMVIMGMLGVAQFVVVHAEPRLIAPFVALISMSCLWWTTAFYTQRNSRLLFISWSGPVTAVIMMTMRIGEGFGANQRALAWHGSLLETTSAMGNDPAFAGRVVIVGEAFQAIADVYGLGWRVAAQVRPASAGAINVLKPEEVATLLSPTLGKVADVVWMVFANGESAFIRLHPAP